jgi:hypothetical protein
MILFIMKHKLLILFFILIPTSLYSQDYVFSIQIKGSALFVEQFNNNMYSKSINIYPLSIYLGNKFKISEDYALEISPGYFYGGENFSGLETGIYLRRNIYDNKIFGAFGINLHYNFGDAHGVMVYEYTPDGIFVNICASVGVNFNKNISFLLSYSKSLSEDYGYSSVFVLEDGSSKQYQRNLFSIIQAGFEFNF